MTMADMFMWLISVCITTYESGAYWWNFCFATVWGLFFLAEICLMIFWCFSQRCWCCFSRQCHQGRDSCFFFRYKKHKKEGKQKTTTDDDAAEMKKRSVQELLKKSDLKRNQDDEPKIQNDCTDLNFSKYLSAITSEAKLGLHAG